MNAHSAGVPFPLQPHPDEAALDPYLLQTDLDEAITAAVELASEDDQLKLINEEDAQFVSRVRAPTGEEMWNMLMRRTEGVLQADLWATWRKALDRASSEQDIAHEAEVFDELDVRIQAIYHEVGHPYPGIVRPNGARNSPTGMLAFWAPMHDGRHVLHPATYTMSRYVLKGYVGGPRQFANDWVVPKISKTQHRNLPDGSSETRLARSLDLFTPETTAKSEARNAARQEIVRMGSENQDGAIAVAATSPSFRFLLGVSVRKQVFLKLEGIVAMRGLKMLADTIEIPISPLPHLGVPPGLTHSIPIRVVFRVDRSGKPVEILGVFMASPHASVGSYARAFRTADLFGKGHQLDAIANLAVVLSGGVVPERYVSSFTLEHWPIPRSDTRSMKKDLVLLAHQEKISGGTFEVTRSVLPADIAEWLDRSGYMPLESDPGA